MLGYSNISLWQKVMQKSITLGDIGDVVPVPRNGKRKKSNASSTVVPKGDAIWRKNLSRDCKFNIGL